MDVTQTLFTEHQVNTVLLLLIFAGLVGLLLVVFYLLDRVNELHKHSGVTMHGHTPIKPDQSFGGLSGKNLWDAMSGIPMPGWSADKLEELKLRYEAVLQKHIELLFEDGQLDGREGFSMPVRCDRVIATLRGEIESWMPHEYATAFYRCGHDRATKPEEEQAAIRERINQTGDALFAATGLPPHSLANLLMPLAPASPEQSENPAEIPENSATLALAAPADDQPENPANNGLALTAEPQAMNLSLSADASEDKALATAAASETPAAPESASAEIK